MVQENPGGTNFKTKNTQRVPGTLGRKSLLAVLRNMSRLFAVPWKFELFVVQFKRIACADCLPLLTGRCIHRFSFHNSTKRLHQKLSQKDWLPWINGFTNAIPNCATRRPIRTESESSLAKSKSRSGKALPWHSGIKKKRSGSTKCCKKLTQEPRLRKVRNLRSTAVLTPQCSTPTKAATFTIPRFRLQKRQKR